jgi:hypothetical protein
MANNFAQKAQPQPTEGDDQYEYSIPGESVLSSSQINQYQY